MLGEVFFSLNGRNGLIYGQWVDMGNILEMTEGIRDFLHIIDRNFGENQKTGQILQQKKAHKMANNQKTSNPFCHFQDISHIYSLAQN